MNAQRQNLEKDSAFFFAATDDRFSGHDKQAGFFSEHLSGRISCRRRKRAVSWIHETALFHFRIADQTT